MDSWKWQDCAKNGYCHFWLSIVVAIAQEQFVRARRGGKPDAVGLSVVGPICQTSIRIFGFDAHISISGCPSMSHLFGDTFFEVSVVENVFATRITSNIIAWSHSAA